MQRMKDEKREEGRKGEDEEVGKGVDRRRVLRRIKRKRRRLKMLKRAKRISRRGGERAEQR